MKEIEKEDGELMKYMYENYKQYDVEVGDNLDLARNILTYAEQELSEFTPKEIIYWIDNGNLHFFIQHKEDVENDIKYLSALRDLIVSIIANGTWKWRYISTISGILELEIEFLTKLFEQYPDLFQLSDSKRMVSLVGE